MKLKLHHAAALALVGWYLLAPPIMRDPEPTEPHEVAALNASLAFWLPYGEFDSAAACHEEQTARQIRGSEMIVKAKNKLSNEDRAAAFRNESVRCVATDDPRLKQK